jgi:hypothetical protein
MVWRNTNCKASNIVSHQTTATYLYNQFLGPSLSEVEKCTSTLDNFASLRFGSHVIPQQLGLYRIPILNFDILAFPSIRANFNMYQIYACPSSESLSMAVLNTQGQNFEEEFIYTWKEAKTQKRTDSVHISSHTGWGLGRDYMNLLPLQSAKHKHNNKHNISQDIYIHDSQRVVNNSFTIFSIWCKIQRKNQG